LDLQRFEKDTTWSNLTLDWVGHIDTTSSLSKVTIKS
jgi:hypothetical protein